MVDETQPKTPGRKQIVQVTAERLRERIYKLEPDQQIGSLPDIARDLGVGIVTVQQAARILEHEGVLEVRRGPGGGYYGRRPDMADLERVLSAYMRSEPASWREVLDITSLLFNRLCAAAARCDDAGLRDGLRAVAARIAKCEDESALGPLEFELQEALFRMVQRPLFELLTRVALGSASPSVTGSSMAGTFKLEQWKDSRRRIIDAVLRQDAELAHFEANRLNRQHLVETYGLENY
jgi:DNA-binding FadR family transcriptional regulator